MSKPREAYLGTFPCGCAPSIAFIKQDPQFLRECVAFMLDRGMSVTRVPSKTQITACSHRDLVTGRVR